MPVQELVSIIVPIYNVENYVNKCIESIIKQTYEKLEILLIDDGATDASGDYCDIWAQKDKRIKVIHQENQGVSAARNRGLEISSGNWVVFVDGDDCIADRYIETLNNLNTNYHTKISCCRCQIEEDGYKEKDWIEDWKTFMYSREYKATVWRYMFAKELFQDICFPMHKTSEDTAILYKLIYQVDYIAVSAEKLYFVTFREDGLNFKERGLHVINQCDVDRIDILKEKAEFFEEKRERMLADTAWKDYLTNILGVYNCNNVCAIQYKINRPELSSLYRQNFYHVKKNRQIPWKLRLLLCASYFWPEAWKILGGK